MVKNMHDTIVALATAPIKSALAIIRLSGPDAFNIAGPYFSKPLQFDGKNAIFYGEIIDGNETIDQVVLLAFKTPFSFTGENVVEIIAHGSMLIANQIIELLIKGGARLATRGEFSSQAFVNGKIDLIQAEAINDMINATTNEGKKLSLLSLQGQTSDQIIPLKSAIADLLTLIEVNIDYPEYTDIEEANKEKIVGSTDALIKTIDRLIEHGRQGQLIKEGINVAIVGKPNVGKSSLLNAFAGEEKAIVTAIAGTTRDVVEAEVNVDGLILHLFDTAGIRESVDIVEKLGISKAKQTLNDADLVLLVLDGSSQQDEEDQRLLDLTADKKRLIVYNKKDLSKHQNKEALYISALNKDIGLLKDKIKGLFGIEEQAYIRPSLNNARQLGLLGQARNALLRGKEDALRDLPVDLIAVSLAEAYYAVLKIIGENNQGDLSEEIFSRFCLGK